MGHTTRIDSHSQYRPQQKEAFYTATVVPFAPLPGGEKRRHATIKQRKTFCGQKNPPAQYAKAH
jgi:hypothetical protein